MARRGIMATGGGRLRPLALTAVVFFTVSGGPYGLEPLLSNVGAIPAILLVLVTPLLWSVPAILMVLELTSMMPRNGGYYQWVKDALGPRWGFLEGWWSWLYTFADLAIYPVLFTQYLTFFAPGVEPFHIVICLAVIWGCVLLNLLGIVPVGRSSILLSITVLFPFLILLAVALLRPELRMSTDGSPHPATLSGLGIGLFTVMWNYLGWDNASTIAEEVEHPLRTYVVSIFSALALIVLMYLLSLLAAISSGADPRLLEHEGFPFLGSLLGGWWLGAVLSVGGMASALGLFLSTLLSISRVPKAMADDRLLPVSLGRIGTARRVPYRSLVLCGIVISGMVLWGFSDLVIIDVLLYGGALFLEFFSLIVLRIRQPERDRPFRVPLRLSGLVLLTLLPAGCWGIALGTLLLREPVHLTSVLFAAAAFLTGPLAWWLTRHAPWTVPLLVPQTDPDRRNSRELPDHPMP